MHSKKADSLQAELDIAQASVNCLQQDWNSYKLRAQVCCNF